MKNGRTSVIAFVSTLEKDAQWGVIREWCENNNIPFLGYTSMMEGKHNVLQALVTGLQDEKKEVESEEDEEAEPEMHIRFDPVGSVETKESEDRTAVERKPRKSKYREPEFIIIFDDLGDELKSPFIATLLKKNRHFKMKVIISTQYLSDIAPAALKQLDMLIVLGVHSPDKLEELHKKVALSLPFGEFYERYKHAVSDAYGFLWIDKNKEEYRKNFRERFDNSE